MWRQIFRQQNDGCKAKESEIGFMRVDSTHVGQWCAFLWPQHTVRSEEFQLLTIEIGCNMIAAVIFTDEPWFNLECGIWRVLVWREIDTRNNRTFVQEKWKSRRGVLMAMGRISIGRLTDLHIIQNVKLMGQIYADGILKHPVVL